VARDIDRRAADRCSERSVFCGAQPPEAPIAEELFTRESLEARWQEMGKKEKKKKKKEEAEP